MNEDKGIGFNRVEVFHKGESKSFYDYGDALDYAKKVTQYEDEEEYSRAYIVRKVKRANLPQKSYIYCVAWVEGSIWLVSDML